MIKNQKIKLNLKESLQEMESFADSPFIKFKISRFIDEDSYEKLVSEVYGLKNFDYVFSGNGEKRKKSINGSNISSVSDGVFKKYCQHFLSENFFLWFKKTHLPFFRKSKIIINVKKPRGYAIRFLAKIKKYIFIPISFYYTEIEYSSIKAGEYIPPHTDSKNKRLSFVHYIPAPDIILTEEMKIKLGTVFWRPREDVVDPMRRFDCSLLDPNETRKFLTEYEPFFFSRYEPNTMVGFIKSDASWHTVETREFEYDRRAIVINVYEL